MKRNLVLLGVVILFVASLFTPVAQVQAANDRGTWVAVFPSAARTSTATSAVKVVEKSKWRGMLLTLNITAASGTTPTMDCKVQVRDPITPAVFIDIVGAAFAQKTTTGTDYLLIYPGTVESANKRVSFVAPNEYRVVCTIGGTTPSFTYTLAASYHQ